MAKPIPTHPRVKEQQAKLTIKTIVDAIVELVTNSDDSYRKLEKKGEEPCGIIEIYVNRKKGGICERLTVKDYAEGMTNKKLEEALEYGGETSGFLAGESVRGIFGRGLKETIMALGEAEIKTVKDRKECKTKVWKDKKMREYVYDEEMLNDVKDTSEENGTEINVKVTNEKISKIMEYEKFKEQVSTHYALRDINSSKNRCISLTFHDLKRNRKDKSHIVFSYPKGKEVEKKEVRIPNFGDKVCITIYESPNPLEFKPYSPYSLAGILIKTEGAILDNQLFEFANDPAAHYFFGEAICEGIANRIRNGEEEILDSTRRGLEWDHEYCQALSSTIKEVLEPHILRKRRELEEKREPSKEVSESTQKSLRRLAAELNKFAKEALELEEDEGITVNDERIKDIVTLTIKPEVANIPKNEPRPFSVYAPDDLVKSEGEEVRIKSDNPIAIHPLASTIKLEQHRKYPEKVWYRYFKIVGKIEGEKGKIIVKLGNKTAEANVMVAPMKKRKKSDIVKPKPRGLFSDIKPDNDGSKTQNQRVFYNESEGIIWINITFPSVLKFIKPGFEDIEETPGGKVLLSELVGEAFCKETARKGLEKGKFPSFKSELDSFNTAVNELQRKFLHRIQEFIFTKFKK